MQHFAVFLTLCSPVCGVSLYNNYDWVSSTCNVLHSTCMHTVALLFLWKQCGHNNTMVSIAYVNFHKKQ